MYAERTPPYFMTQSIHILKAGRDAHAHTRTRTQSTSTVPAWGAHIIMVETIRNTAESVPAAAVVSQQVYAPKTGVGRLEIPVCGCCGDDIVITH